tara:strand:+ start:243 stop:728 length:486 start_codon:yes stop_codon:yes gene_type:complete
MQEPPMTPEQKAAVMQFMGQTYGHAHKQDQMIIGQSGNLSPNSSQLKQVFEQTARMPTVQRPHPQAPPQQEQPPEALPPQVTSVSPEQAAQELQQQSIPPPPVGPKGPEGVPGQLDLDFSEPSKVDKLISILEKQNLILKEISLKLDNGKPSKANKQKRVS